MRILKTYSNAITVPNIHVARTRVNALLAFVLLMLCCNLLLEIAANWNIILDSLITTDKRAMLLLNFKGSATTDSFWYGYSHMRAWIPLILVTVGSVVYYHPGNWKEKLTLIIAIALLITVLDQLSSTVIKNLTARPRPSHDPSLCYLLHYVNGYHGGRYGFVSGHATNIVGITTVLCYIFRNRFIRLTLCLFAAMMCYSRIYLGVHFPGDIICGALLGYGVATLMLRTLGRKIHVYSTCCCPGLIIIFFTGTLLYLLF